MKGPKYYLNPNYLHKKSSGATSLLVFSVLCSMALILSFHSSSSTSTVEIGTNVLDKRVEIGSSVSFTIDLYNSDEINSYIINMSLTFTDNKESHPSYSFSKRSLLVPAQSFAETILTFDCNSNCTAGEKISASIIGYHSSPFIQSNSNNITNTLDIVIDPFDSYTVGSHFTYSKSSVSYNNNFSIFITIFATLSILIRLQSKRKKY